MFPRVARGDPNTVLSGLNKRIGIAWRLLAAKVLRFDRVICLAVVKDNLKRLSNVSAP